MHQTKRYLILIIVLAALIGSFKFGVYIGKEQVICEVCPPSDINFSLFWEAWKKISESYVNSSKLNTQEMIYGAIAGMVNSLKDPYTVFFNPDESKKFLEDVTGEFEGVGMEIGIRKGQLQVVAPLDNSPAEQAGLRPGDKIVKIGDKSTADMPIEEAVNLIRGPKGTEVKLSIYRNGWDAPKEFIIKRAVIVVPSIDWRIIDNNIAYIKISHFSENATWDFHKAAAEILKSSSDRIILDLRNNPGGYLEVSQDIAGWFIEKDKVVVIEDFGGKRDKKVYYAEGNARLLGYPIVILVNEGSASAAEILAAAIKENRSAQIIGKNSFGKGSVQELENLSDSSSLKITVANWLTPNGNLITDVGLKPDIEVDLTEDDYDNDRDPQLDKAIEIIRNIK
ncbi:MAG: S41 family peptidase [Candidatus Pacebacteria bacterium]|nr:S41 family peptidase [Candidatus Paceibacterota bacterium]